MFVIRVGYTGNAVLRQAVRAEIRLFTSELATDLARFPILREWTTDDLQMLAGQLVNTMIATVGAMLDAPVAAPQAEAEIARMAEKQLRLTLLAVPHWRSSLSVTVGGVTSPRTPLSWWGWGDPGRSCPSCPRRSAACCVTGSA